MNNIQSPSNSDHNRERDIADLKLNGPRVTKEMIEALMARVVYITEQPVGTTTTLAHAFLDGKFFLATGMTACVDPNNFNRELGLKYAILNATPKAQDKLWELEGYSLYKSLDDL